MPAPAREPAAAVPAPWERAGVVREPVGLPERVGPQPVAREARPVPGLRGTPVEATREPAESPDAARMAGEGGLPDRPARGSNR